jgi:hypothetical protein
MTIFYGYYKFNGKGLNMLEYNKDLLEKLNHSSNKVMDELYEVLLKSGRVRSN